MGELGDRRARKKAATREQIRTTAHRLFAEHGFDGITIADVARASEVAVQTVFNHFATKEELFFDGRVPWVDGPATSVMNRAPGVDPLSALRSYLLSFIGTDLSALDTPEQRCYRTTVSDSETLRMYERGLVFEAEYRLADALQTTWEADAAAGRQVPPEPATAAPLTAAVWLAAARVLIVENRMRVVDGQKASDVATAIERLGDRLLGYMESGWDTLTGLTTDLPPLKERPAYRQVS